MGRRFALVAWMLAMLTGCGGGGGVPAGSTPATDEKADAPAALLKGWTVEQNGPSGLTVGVPPDWTAVQRGSSTVLASPSRLVVVSISADRTDEALKAPLRDLAVQTAAHLTGFNTLDPGDPVHFEARYEALEVAATATRDTGEPQRLTLIVLRTRSAVFSLLAAANERLKPDVGESIAAKIAQTIRYRPVEVTG